MNARLDKAFKAAAKLSPEQQEAIARDILERLKADARWDIALAKLRSRVLLKRLADEARDDIARGDVLDGDPATRTQ